MSGERGGCRVLRQPCEAPVAQGRPLRGCACAPSGSVRLVSRGKATLSEIVRRLGVAPRYRGSAGGGTCPDIFELTDGNFAVIGTDATDSLDAQLPADAARADYERIVVITRETLVRAKADIPDA